MTRLKTRRPSPAPPVLSNEGSAVNDHLTARQNKLGTTPVKKLLVSFAVPSIIALIVSALYNIVDQIFIGWSVGMLGNAATNVAFPLVTICTAIALLCGIGGAANFNLSLGRKEEERAKSFAGNAIFLMFFLGILLMLVTRIFLQPLLVVFGGTPEVLDYAKTYTSITSLGFPVLIFTVGGSNLVRADGSPTYSMLCILSGCILNTILDPLFIFGFNMGIAGAAWATVIGQIVSAIMVAGYLRRFRTVKLSLKDLRPRLHFSGNIIKLGMSPFFNQISILFVQVVLNNLFVYYGARSEYGANIPLAATGIIMKVSMIFFSICIGIAQGLQPIVSFNYGAKNYARVREAFKWAAISSLAVSTGAFLLFQIFPRQIIGFFGSGSDAYFTFAVIFFRTFLFSYFLDGIQPIAMNFFTSIGKAQKGILISLSRQIIFFIPLAIIFGMLWGIHGVMYAAPVADAMAAFLSFALFFIEIKLMKRMEAEEEARSATATAIDPAVITAATEPIETAIESQ